MADQQQQPAVTPKPSPPTTAPVTPRPAPTLGPEPLIDIGSTVRADDRAGMGVVTNMRSGGQVHVRWPLERLEEWRPASSLKSARANS